MIRSSIALILILVAWASGFGVGAADASLRKGVEPNSWDWAPADWGDRTGLGVVRLAVDWNEPFASLDGKVAAAGPAPIIMLGDTAAPNPAVFAARAAEVALRYPGARIQVFNEPNTERFWGRAPNPGEYAELLRTTHAAVKAVSPSTQIITAGLAPTGEESLFMGAVLASAPADAVAAHPYASTPAESAQALERINGMTDLPIVITEFGWGTDCSPAAAWCVDEATQATYLTHALDHFAAAGGVTDAIWYELRDSPTCTSSFDCRAGLYRPDGTAKPARDALRNWTHTSVPASVPTKPAPPTLRTATVRRTVRPGALVRWRSPLIGRVRRLSLWIAGRGAAYAVAPRTNACVAYAYGAGVAIRLTDCSAGRRVPYVRVRAVSAALKPVRFTLRLNR